MYCYNCMRQTEEDIIFCSYCGEEIKSKNKPHHLSAGTVLNGKYLVGNYIGEGGFGITYVGLNKNLNQKIAVKEYYPYGLATRNNTISNDVTFNFTEDGENADKGIEKFLQEAQNIAKFSAEKSIVYVSDFFKENGTAYIIMEYLDGITLGKKIQKETMTPGEILRLMTPLMESLDKMHSQKILHRDISPDNIMILKDGSIKLMDFGSARIFSEFGSKTMSVMLKPGYAPYEQYYKKGNQGPWTDVYGVCATMYKCITGKTPMDSIERGKSDKLKKPSRLGVEISEKFENALMSGLEVYPENRCQSMRELMVMLTDAAHITPVTDDDNEAREPDETALRKDYKTRYADGDYDSANYNDGFTFSGVNEVQLSAVEAVESALAQSTPDIPIENKEIESINDYVFGNDDKDAGEESEKCPNLKKRRVRSVIGGVCIAFIIAAGLIGIYAVLSDSGFSMCAPQHNAWSFDGDTGALTLSGDIAKNDFDSEKDFASADVKSLVVDSGVTYLDDNMFKNYKNLTSASMAKGMTKIGAGAFSGCKKLENISIPDSVVRIGDSAFENCFSLKIIEIHGRVTDIGKKLFSDCVKLKSVTIPDTVASIGDYAFLKCKSLEVINIPENVTSIGVQAFEGCESLKNVTIPDSVTKIGNYAFADCENLVGLKISHGVTSIGYRAFSNCKLLFGVTIPSNVEEIGENAFGYVNNENGQYSKLFYFIIKCEKGSAAEAYAKANNIWYSYY